MPVMGFKVWNGDVHTGDRVGDEAQAGNIGWNVNGLLKWFVERQSGQWQQVEEGVVGEKQVVLDYRQFEVDVAGFKEENGGKYVEYMVS